MLSTTTQPIPNDSSSGSVDVFMNQHPQAASSVNSTVSYLPATNQDMALQIGYICFPNDPPGTLRKVTIYAHQNGRQLDISNLDLRIQNTVNSQMEELAKTLGLPNNAPESIIKRIHGLPSLVSDGARSPLSRENSDKWTAIEDTILEGIHTATPIISAHISSPTLMSLNGSSSSASSSVILPHSSVSSNHNMLNGKNRKKPSPNPGRVYPLPGSSQNSSEESFLHLFVDTSDDELL